MLYPTARGPHRSANKIDKRDRSANPRNSFVRSSTARASTRSVVSVSLDISAYNDILSFRVKEHGDERNSLAEQYRADTLPGHGHGLRLLRRQDREGGALGRRERCEGFDRDADHDAARR